VARVPALSGAACATYAAAVREGGEVRGKPIGVLGIHFDWAPQAQAVIDGVRLSPAEAARSRVLLLDAHGRVLAASDGRGVLEERVSLHAAPGQASGCKQDADGGIIAFHRTPGYETYRGLGWCGAILQRGRGWTG
jgi:hypothetical protein